MSQGNAERADAALNRSDFDAVLEFFAPDAELRDLANAPDQAAVVRGVDSIREAWELWTTAFDEFNAEIEELIEAGDAGIETVHWQGRGKASGMSIDVRQFDVYEFRDGKTSGPR